MSKIYYTRLNEVTACSRLADHPIQSATHTPIKNSSSRYNRAKVIGPAMFNLSAAFLRKVSQPRNITALHQVPAPKFPVYTATF